MTTETLSATDLNIIESAIERAERTNVFPNISSTVVIDVRMARVLLDWFVGPALRVKNDELKRLEREIDFSEEENDQLKSEITKLENKIEELERQLQAAKSLIHST